MVWNETRTVGQEWSFVGVRKDVEYIELNEMSHDICINEKPVLALTG